MARIFKDCFEMVREMDRELKVSGITVPVKHYQNIELHGDEQLTKELIGVNFVITKPNQGQESMLRFMFGDEANKIMEYCQVELKDRISPVPLNPGNSYKVRMDLWQQLMSRNKEGKFDYTYSERIASQSQLKNVLAALADDPHSRRAMVMIYTPADTRDAQGASTRIPCSISYQFLIRNNKLMVVYYIRSNDYYKHFPIDVIMTSLMQQYILGELRKGPYPDLKLGSLTYFAGSLHAYKSDLDKHVVF